MHTKTDRATYSAHSDRLCSNCLKHRRGINDCPLVNPTLSSQRDSQGASRKV
ncbi:hypothetical protein [Spirosoma soli]|uniref:hypothetical protein n=1 Tax=Spirosoma soli TaxID=1770529 RepID=UPI0036D2584C